MNCDKHDPSRDLRKCTCHPADNPPVPCARKFAYTECVLAAHLENTILKFLLSSSCFGREVCPSRPCACARTIADFLSRAGAEPRHSQPELITSRDRLASRDDASGPNSEFDSRDGSQFAHTSATNTDDIGKT